MSLIPGPGRGGGEWHLSILLNVRILEVCFASSSILCYELEPLHCSLSSTDYLGARASPQLPEMSNHLHLSFFPLSPSSLPFLLLSFSWACSIKCEHEIKHRLHRGNVCGRTCSNATLPCLLHSACERAWTVPLPYATGKLSPWFVELSFSLNDLLILKCLSKYQILNVSSS